MKTSKIILAFVVFTAFAGVANTVSAFNPMASTKGVACTSNLRQIAIVCKLYADSNNGKYPAGDTAEIVKLLKNEQLLSNEQLWRCPGVPKTIKVPPAQYIIIGGLSDKMSPKMPLVIDRIGNHEGVINVAFIDASFVTIKSDAKTYSELLQHFDGITEKEKGILKEYFTKLDSAK